VAWKDIAVFHYELRVTNMKQSIQREPAFLRRRQVETCTGLSRSTIYQYIKEGVFPKPVPLGPRAVGWLESDMSDWIAARVKIARDGVRPRNMQRFSAAALDDVHGVAGRYLAGGKMADTPMNVIAQLLPPSVDGECRQVFARSGEVVVGQTLERLLACRVQLGLLLFPRDIDTLLHFDALLCCELAGCSDSQVGIASKGQLLLLAAKTITKHPACGPTPITVLLPAGM